MNPDFRIPFRTACRGFSRMLSRQPVKRYRRISALPVQKRSQRKRNGGGIRVVSDNANKLINIRPYFVAFRRDYGAIGAHFSHFFSAASVSSVENRRRSKIRQFYVLPSVCAFGNNFTQWAGSDWYWKAIEDRNRSIWADSPEIGRWRFDKREMAYRDRPFSLPRWLDNY